MAQNIDVNKIANAIKSYMVNLAIEDRFPMDLTQLCETTIGEIIQENLPTPNELRIERASHYLCEGSLSIKEQLVLIDKQAEIDDSVSLEDVNDNIIVWEKVSDRFNVQDFLEEIDN